MAQGLDPVQEGELVHLVALEGYKVPGRALNTLFDSEESRTEDTAGCLGSDTRFGTDDDSLLGLDDCQGDSDDPDVQDILQVFQPSYCTWKEEELAVADVAVVVAAEKMEEEVVGVADSRDVRHLYHHSVVGHQMDC